MKEAKAINKSLSALGDVISALTNKENFVPYRNNKLTQLLSDSMGGNAKTLMFCNVAPNDYNSEETIISLTYAARVKLITNKVSKNAVDASKSNQEIKALLEKITGRKNVDVNSLLEMDDSELKTWVKETK